eukprot:jgi/Phyca11/535284/estExt2_fgenesh1_pg.C_PHYCAscaffold_330117
MTAPLVVELAVEGMMCMKNCGNTVQSALRSVEGVSSAVVDFERRSARVECVPGACVTADDLVDAVECVGFGAAVKAPAQQRQTQSETIELLVEGMMCQKNCGSTVENALKGVDGVASAVVSFEQRKATVTLLQPGSATLEQLVDMVECVGFEASAYDAAKAAAIKFQAQKQKQQEEEVTLDIPDAAGHPRAVFHVEGMSCAACVKAIEDYVGKAAGVLHCRVGLISQKAEIETAVGALPGVTKVLVNLPLNKAHVHLKQLSKTGPRDLLECINGLGYSAEVAQETTDQHALSKSEVEKWRKLLTTAMLFSLPAMLIHMVLMYIPPVEMLLMTPVFNAVTVKLLLLFLLATPVQFGVGRRFYVAAWKGLQHGAMGMDFLVVAGTTMSYTYSFVSFLGSALHENYEGHHFFESSAMLLTFVTLGNSVTSRNTPVSVLVGNSEYCEEKGIEISDKMRSHMHELELEGKTVVVVCVEKKLVGVIALADAARPEAAAVVKHLKSMGLDVWLITGDNLRTASAIARQMGINHVKAVALPGEKASQIKALQSQVNPLTLKPRVVCMVGDGINDAPALAQSDIGMAIGAGTQIAKAEADMVLVKSALTDVVVALDLARVVFSRIKLNFFFSIIYNVIGIPLAAGMFFPLIHRMMPPACAGLAMAFSSVSVVMSSLLLKKYKVPQILQTKAQKVHFEEDAQVVDLKNLVRLKLSNVRYAPLTNVDEQKVPVQLTEGR